jgi:hypothetical protein
VKNPIGRSNVHGSKTCNWMLGKQDGWLVMKPTACSCEHDDEPSGYIEED